MVGGRGVAVGIGVGVDGVIKVDKGILFRLLSQRQSVFCIT